MYSVLLPINMIAICIYFWFIIKSLKRQKKPDDRINAPNVGNDPFTLSNII